MPFEYIDIQNQKDGAINCYACCPTILPVKVGDLKKNTIEEIWNGKIYNDIRQTILDGTYDNCNAELCPEIQSDRLFDINSSRVHHIAKAKKEGIDHFTSKPRMINLSYDRTCNLACPSCRTDFVTSNSDEDEELISKITDDLLSRDLSNTTIVACSSGDPFVGKHFRRLLFTLDGKKHPGLKLQIMTNGILFNRQAWESMHKIHKNISSVYISIDAATEATYGITRRGGNWNLLMKNIEFISMLRARNEIGFLRLDFVVQDHNYQEMIEFVSLGKKFKADEVFFQKVANWGFFTPEEFIQRAVYKEDHPDYVKFLEVLGHENLKDGIVNHGNLGHFFSEKHVKRPFNFKNAVLHSIRNIRQRFFLT